MDTHILPSIGMRGAFLLFCYTSFFNGAKHFYLSLRDRRHPFVIGLHILVE